MINCTLIAFLLQFVVRVADSLKPLKDHLFHNSRTMLRNMKVPRVCFQLYLKGTKKVVRKQTPSDIEMASISEATQSNVQGKSPKHKRFESCHFILAGDRWDNLF